MTARCQGGCGNAVTEAGKWCSSCWPIEVSSKHVDQSDPIRPTHDLQSLRFQIAAAGFKVGFGRESERAEALDKLIHLAHVLEHETKTNKET